MNATRIIEVSKELNMIGVVAYMKITMMPILFLIRARSNVFIEYSL